MSPILSQLKDALYSTGGSPPWIPDLETIDNSNEPYLEWLEYTLKQKKIPQTFSTSYGDNEQTVSLSFIASPYACH